MHFFTHRNEIDQLRFFIPLICLLLFINQVTKAQSLGVSLQKQNLETLDDGTYNITFDIKCKNYSLDTIKQFNVAFNFEKYFGSNCKVDLLYHFLAYNNTSLIIENSSFANLISDSLLLKSNCFILPNNNVNIGFKFNLRLNGLVDSVVYVNAKAYGTQNGNFVCDYSTNGDNVDPNFDNIPSECELTPLHFSCNDVIIPNVFTPNNDGANDVFKIKNILRYNNELKIFNRWGKIVYQAKDYKNNWKGAYKPNADEEQIDDLVYLEEGTYYYILNYGLIDNKSLVKYGTITLFR